MDIAAGAAYPANALSNFAPHPFIIDGVECASMEGFLQSLKFKNPDMQVEVCKLVGRAAKMKGKGKDWRQGMTLWWRGKPIKRDSKEYQQLLDRAYEALFWNTGFQAALKAAGEAKFEHSLGKNNIKDTVLTRQEFCHRLDWLREKLICINLDNGKNYNCTW